MEKEKDLKYENHTNEEDKMALLGSCRGIWGLRKSLNWVFILDIIFLIFGGGYFIYSKDYILSLGVFGIFLVVLVFLMANSRIRRN